MKTRLYTRKRALISSVAMLLVAMIALGTATFAWFTKSTTATADQINVKTIKASDLQISKLNKDWGTSVHYGMTSAKVLQPVSTANGSNWFYANAGAKNSYAPKSGEAASAVTSTNKGDYYFAEELNVRNNGEADVENVTISISISDASTKTGYLRVALVPVSDNDENTDTLKTPQASDFFKYTTTGSGATEKNTLDNIFGETDTNGYQALTGATVASDLSAKVYPNATYSLSVGTLKAKDATLTEGQRKSAYYNIYVWFEGQDHDCLDANAGASIPSITLSVSGDTVTQS